MTNANQNNTGANKTTTRTIRCAVYTRKSTEEGLDQDFNSLDAQWESAAAYIASQKHEGWVCLSNRYDDGGFSGGSTERPALQRLLADIEAGKIDCVLVYKVDRLSRSLLDFAKIMEVFDKHGASFVSVTQQFNTTSSMGRLTLNILLSFAQFEREIIAERTRDKMSAARRKGKWIGGMLVLGYDLDRVLKRLVVNAEEADRVRKTFDLYLENGSLLPTVQALNQLDWQTKRWVTKKGKIQGGKPYDKASLYSLLTNYIYLGKVDFKGVIYAGEQSALVDEAIFLRVQEMLRKNHRGGSKVIRNKYGALLKGLLFCAPCNSAMVHCFTKRDDQLYRYYVCIKAQKSGWNTCPSKSLPAHEIEKFVVGQIRRIGTDPLLRQSVVAQTQSQQKENVAGIRSERQRLERELRQASTEIGELVTPIGSTGATNSWAVARLADLQESVQRHEQTLLGIRTQEAAFNAQGVDAEEVSQALQRFDPLWDTLAPREQSRVVQLLVEAVLYDGAQASLSLSFRPTGLKALTQLLPKPEVEVPHASQIQ